MYSRFLINFKLFLPFLLPILIPFSRAIADITIIFVCINFLVYSYLCKDWNWIRDKWFKYALLFWVYCLLIVSPLSINPEKSFLYSIYFIRWPLFSVALAYWIFTNKKSISIFLKISSIIFIFLCLDTWWQYFNGEDLFGYVRFSQERLTGPFDRPIIGIWLGKLFLFIPFLFYLLGNFQIKKIDINLFLIFMIVLVITTFITGERMALIINSISILILFYGVYVERLISLKRFFLISLLLILIIFIFYLKDPTIYYRSIVSTIDKIVNWRMSDYGIVWESAYMVWIKSPLYGSGFHTYREACDSLLIYGSHDNPVGSGVCFHPHNISMELLSELGIIGFVLFFVMIFFIAFKLKINNHNKNYFLLATYFSILVSCFFPLSSGMSIFSNKLASLIWLLIGFTLAFNKLVRELNSK